MKKYIRFLIIASLPAFFLIQLAGCKFFGDNAKVASNIIGKPFENLSEYHFFKGNLKDLSPNEKVLPYNLISTLFTDYAHKARFVYIPDGKQVDYQEETALNLPVGACYIKNFYYPNDFRDELKGRRIIETRLLVHKESGWETLEYIWNDEQTDAYYEIAGDLKKVSWIHNDGSKKEIDYVIPNQNQCKGCHLLSNVVMPIGPKVRNLNQELAYADGKMNQLQKWTKNGILKDAPADIASCPKMVNYNDTSADLNLRARAYLDINCAHCHNPNGPAYTSGLWLHYNQEEMEHVGLCKSPVAAGRGTGGLMMDIVPGDPEHSILKFRMASLDAGIKMPELGRTTVHEEGVALITQWITDMKGSCGKAAN